ncbi:MAG: HAMP domain-containing protein [Acidobacteria bacterium]|nr:HAMP domain-containing protein [Acidobacteriota bacterium]
MRRIPFFIKIWSAFTGVLALFGALVAVTTVRSAREFNRQEVAGQLLLAALALGDDLDLTLAHEGEEQLNRRVVNLGGRLGLRITVVAPDVAGRVIADSAHDPRLMEGHAQRMEISRALETGYGQSARYSETTQVDRLYVAIPWPNRENARFVLRTSRELAGMDALAAPFLGSFLAACGAALLLALGISFLITCRMTRPMGDLAQAARRLSAGDFTARVHQRQAGEFHELAGAFNAMAEKVQRLFGELGRRDEEWSVVLSAIREALVVIDRDFTVVRANKAFCALAGTADVAGKPYWSVIRAPRFGGLLEAAGTSAAPVTEVLALHDREFLCSLSPLSDGNRTAVLLFDITEFRRLEAVKRDLVVNFSHEFKTPLASIQGYAEMMASEDPPNREHAAIIRRNAERLARITDDLLLLADLERRDRSLNLEPVELGELLSHVEEQFRPLLAGKGLTLTRDLAEGFPPLQADPFLLEQVFTNLVSNAVRHTAQGGITVRARRVARRAVIEVSDTGEGIPEAHLDRIFERFYVVDKSRSRRRDGTGLGLSIVRNIVLRHGGEISVASRLGEGTTFTVCLPLPETGDQTDGRE